MENNSPQIAINKNWLLRVYWITPLLSAVVALDIFFFDRSLLPYMGLESMLLPLYLLIFELPHIVGSFLGFADREYIQHYRKKLFIVLPLILVSVGALMYWHLTLAITLYLVATMYHVVKQQTGISLIFGAARGLWQSVWTWTGVLVSSLLYVYFIVPEIFPSWLLQPLNLVFLALVLMFVFAGGWVRHTSHTPFAKSYVLQTTILFSVAYVLILSGYLFFAFFLVRFVHDISAFFFYVTHETNRNYPKIRNVIYKFLSAVPLPIYVLVPVLSIVIAYSIRTGITDEALIYAVVILSGFAHYYLESIIWKKDALHRNEIKIT